MLRLLLKSGLLSLLALVSACQGGRDLMGQRTLDLSEPAASIAQAVRVDEQLLNWLASADAEESIEVIVSFRGKSGPSAEQLELLRSLGLTGLHLNYLPIAGVVAKPLQLRALMDETEQVRSLWFNAEVQYEDDAARYMTSVDQAYAAPELVNAAGEPITGKGVTILVNDSGIDATHQDLLYGDKVVANALGHTNLRSWYDMAPFTPVEDVPNTDVLGSHGTHVAGIAAGNGAMSGGQYAGAARGASLAGYGSGAALLVLDTLGGFDYALQLMDTRPELNLRIVTNSFGTTSDQATRFDPENPTNIATKMLADAGIIVVFSAGNSGSGSDSITGNYKKAPWVLVAANGTKDGLLAGSSSRGAIADGVYEVEVDGEMFTIEDRPLVVTPGTDIIAARAVAADPFTPLDLEADVANGDIPPQLIPFYTQKTGTSMAAPHLAGLVALLLEANPDLDWRQLKAIFKATATNMPGYEPWEVGAGYANIEAALAMALELRQDYGQTSHLLNEAQARVPLGETTTALYSFDFTPVPEGASGSVQFEVGEDIALVTAAWTQPEGDPCTCAIVLYDPDGVKYGSGIALPVLGPRVSTAAPGKPGIWTLSARGIGSVSGVTVDPLGVTNGVAGPTTLEDVQIQLFASAEAVGLNDVAGHPDEDFILKAVSERLVDGKGGAFVPDAPLNRGDFAQYLSAWGLRQTRAHNGGQRFADVSGASAAAADMVSRQGQLLMDRATDSRALLELEAGSFNGVAGVSREQVAYALVQAIGHQAAAEAHDAQSPLVAYDADDNLVEVADSDRVSPALYGHVQQALLLKLISPVFIDGEAYVEPQAGVSRAEFSIISVKAFGLLPFDL